MRNIKSKNVKLTLTLSPEEKAVIKAILNRGKESVRVIKRARVLDLFDKGFTSPTISEYVGVTAETARRIGWNYLEGGLKRALYDLPRPGKERALTEKQANQIIACVCSDPPAGYSRWTIELLTEETKRRGIAPKIGRETIRILLKTHDLKPWREKNVVHPGTNK